MSPETHILVRLSGGLGNQLFQFAASLYIARELVKLNLTPLVHLDSRFLGDYDASRAFELDFLIKYYPFVINQNNSLGFSGALSKFRIARVMNGQLLRIGFARDYPGINKFDLSKLKSIVIDGYFQVPSFLIPQYERMDLLGRLKLDFYYLPHKPPVIGAHEKVSIHIRRGDYVSVSAAAKEFLTIGLDYYRAAVKRFPEGTRFYVFGDDAQVVGAFSKEIGGVNVLALNLTLQEEFVLMADSMGYIIANSTLSWWAAFIGYSQEKRVISPSNWFVDHVRNKNNILQLDYFELV